MIVVRFKVKCLPEKRDALLAAMRDVIEPSRKLQGVINFDIGQDLGDPDSLIATEIFESLDALNTQEAQPEVARVLELLPDSLAAEPEATIYHVSSTEAWG